MLRNISVAKRHTETGQEGSPLPLIKKGEEYRPDGKTERNWLTLHRLL